MTKEQFAKIRKSLRISRAAPRTAVERLVYSTLYNYGDALDCGWQERNAMRRTAIRFGDCPRKYRVTLKNDGRMSCPALPFETETTPA